VKDTPQLTPILFHIIVLTPVLTAGSAKFVPADDPLQITLEEFHKDFAVNTDGLLVATKRAVKGFEQMPSDVLKTLIFTGNITNESSNVIPALISQGLGKAASANLLATVSKSYAPKGYR
jgi:hypothetical protein